LNSLRQWFPSELASARICPVLLLLRIPPPLCFCFGLYKALFPLHPIQPSDGWISVALTASGKRSIMCTVRPCPLIVSNGAGAGQRRGLPGAKGALRVLRSRSGWASGAEEARRLSTLATAEPTRRPSASWHRDPPPSAQARGPHHPPTSPCAKRLPLPLPDSEDSQGTSTGGLERSGVALAKTTPVISRGIIIYLIVSCRRQ
jgi:hypothetical protein